MKKIFIIISLIAAQKTYADALSSISGALGNLISKKEDENFIKYRTSDEYNSFFSRVVTSSNELKSLYEQYQQFNSSWKTLTVSKYNQQVPELNAKLEKPIAFARMYDFVDYLINRSGAYIDPPAKAKMTSEFLSGVVGGAQQARCRPKAPIMADKEIANKTIKYKEYLFLSEDCSQKLKEFLTSQQTNIDKFFGFASSATQETEQTPESQEKERNSLGKLREQCEQSVTPACATLAATLYVSAKNRTLVSMQYGKGYTTALPVFDTELELKLSKCKDAKNFDQTICAPVIQEITTAWNQVDEKQDLELYPNPLSYLSQNEDILEKALTDQDFKRQVLFENYEEYKDIDSVFSQIYSMACALDPSFRLRVSPVARANFLEQELISGNNKVTNFAKGKIAKIQERIKKMLESDKTIIASIAKAASENAKVPTFENEFLPPLHIATYIQDWDKLSTQMVKKGDDNVPITDLLLSENPYVSETKAPVDYDGIYAILTKICMSILGSEYLKVEKMIKDAVASQDKNKVDQTIKSLSQDTNIQDTDDKKDSKKESRAFRYLPSGEYNKLRQLALIFLTNIHVLLLDELEKKRGNQGSFHSVAQQIKSAFTQQITVLARFIFSLKEKNFEASDLSASTFSDAFAQAFLMPIYPLERTNIPNQATLVDAAGTNMYSLYTSYLLGSIYGIVALQDNWNVMMDNRGAKNRMLGNFVKEFGVEASVNLEWVVQGAVKATLDLLPIPKPPVITSIAVTAVSTILLAGPQYIYKGLKSTCRFNKDKCINKSLKQVNLTRPLEVRITEFLESVQSGLINMIKRQNPNATSQEFDRLMPTLFVLKNDDIAKFKEAYEQQKPISSVSALIEKLTNDTKTYYQNLY
ncbi:MAG: hypothetical protein CNLJKLNK_00065 [Holosporales bacterium]